MASRAESLASPEACKGGSISRGSPIGQHPHHRRAAWYVIALVQEYEGADGKAVAPVEHRAGWDATFSAPKSVSLTALVGGDDRVRDAHQAAVNVALNELERYTQARIGGNHPAETTGEFIAAKFEHATPAAAL